MRTSERIRLLVIGLCVLTVLVIWAATRVGNELARKPPDPVSVADLVTSDCAPADGMPEFIPATVITSGHERLTFDNYMSRAQARASETALYYCRK